MPPPGLPVSGRSVDALESAPAPASPTAAPTVVLFLDHTAAASGGEIALFRLIESLNPQAVRPIVLFAADGPLVARLRALQVEVHILPLGAGIRNLRKDTLGFGALWKLGAMLGIFLYALRVAWFARRCGAQIIHANSLKSDIYGAIAGTVARIPVIWHVRDHINPSYLPALAVHAFRFLARKIPSYIVTNSQSTLDELHLNHERPAAVVPSGFNVRSGVVHDGLGDHELREEFPIVSAATAASDQLKSWHHPIRVGIVGRIARWKGQHIFIQAAAQVTAAGHDAEFWIVGAPLFGEETYEAELRAQVAAAGLNDRVHFLGFQENVQETIRQLDVVVHASITPEPFGQVVIEAMAEGLPVIATDGGGVREIVQHRRNGLLVPMGDAPALAATLGCLLSQPGAAQALGAAGHRWVRRHFTSAQSARKIEFVYRSILQSR